MNRSTRPVIGVLAGMGPRSTAPFVSMMIDECLLQLSPRSELDYPEIIVLSWPTPFDPEQPLDHGAIESSILEGLGRLESMGADFVAMPCNTAHIYYDALRQAMGIPLLNMIELACKALPDGGPAALFSTRATRDSKIYHRTAASWSKNLLHDEALQFDVDRLITDIKRAPDPGALEHRWRDLVQHASSLGAQSVLVGCTDLNAAIDSDRKNSLPLIDGTRILAGATVSMWRSLLPGVPSPRHGESLSREPLR